MAATSSSIPGPDDILDNISMLYELSLSIGTSLDLHENCEFFAQKLMARQNLSFAAIYADGSLQSGSERQTESHSQYCCLYTCPQLSNQELEQVVSDELLEQVKSQGILCLDTQNSTETILPQGALDSFSGIFSAFSVCQGQILIIFINQIRDTVYPCWELNQLRLLLDKFGRSVEACLNHESLRQTTQAKIRLEQRLGRSQRLESLGLMAGGIAHDLGNILNPLVAYPDFLSRSFPEGTQEQYMLSEMQKAADKASAMMKDLLVLTRQAESSHVAIPLAVPILQYLTSASFLSLQSAEPNISCQWQFNTESRILADSTVITRVILNLVMNAFDALHGQGNIEIQVCDRDFSQPHEGYTTVPTGQYVVLMVKDNGPGIPKDALGHIFEPFFSKKKLGRSGSGLGLSVVYSLVKGLDGFIDVQTGKEGTEFIVYFPRWGNEAVVSASDLHYSTGDSCEDSARLAHPASRPLQGQEVNKSGCLNPGSAKKSAQEIILDEIAFMPKDWSRELELALSSLRTQSIEEQVEEIPREHERLKGAIQCLLRNENLIKP